MQEGLQQVINTSPPCMKIPEWPPLKSIINVHFLNRAMLLKYHIFVVLNGISLHFIKCYYIHYSFK